MNDNRRMNSGGSGMMKSTMKLTAGSADESVQAENYEYERHEQQAGAMENAFDPSIQPTEGCTAAESYDAFFQDAFGAINAEMENYYSSLGKMEEKEANVKSEISSKTEEMIKLSRILREKRDSALQAIAKLTTHVCEHNNAQN